MKNTILLSLLSLVLLTGCSALPSNKVSSQSDSKPVIVSDASGNQFRLIRLEKKITESISERAVWERISPADTKNYYTPSLSSAVHPDLPMTFERLDR
jgi:ABC-type Fe3+-hydroxamate transport system substrate-binding protein